MVQIKEGSPIKYFGAFYPQKQDEYNYASWKNCANDVNTVLATHANFSQQSFVDQVVKGDKNNWASRWALCWDVNYAYLVGYDEDPDTRRNNTKTLLNNAMICVKKSINSMGIDDAEKEQYWSGINWGGFVADEPINDPDPQQDTDQHIDNKCIAVQDALDEASADTSDGLTSWPSHTIRKMVVLHRMGDDPNTGQFPQSEYDDGDFQSIASDWVDGPAKYRVNLWGIDPYIAHGGNFAIVDQDRDWLFDAVVYELGAATENSHFMVMVGKAYRDTDPLEPWLDESECWYYYSHIKGWSSKYGVYWEDQFLALFWWAYCTAVIEPGVQGYDQDPSNTKVWIDDITGANF